MESVLFGEWKLYFPAFIWRYKISFKMFFLENGNYTSQPLYCALKLGWKVYFLESEKAKFHDERNTATRKIQAQKEALVFYFNFWKPRKPINFFLPNTIG